MARANAKNAVSTTFRLLDLPPELRNRIYHMILITNDLIWIETRGLLTATDIVETGSFFEPPMLSVCQQIRNEATSIFYASNAFEGYDGVQISTWLKMLTLEKRNLLNDVWLAPKLHVIGGSRNPWAAQLELENIRNYLQNEDIQLKVGTLAVELMLDDAEALYGTSILYSKDPVSDAAAFVSSNVIKVGCFEPHFDNVYKNNGGQAVFWTRRRVRASSI